MTNPKNQQNYKTDISGRCWHCNVRYIWKKVRSLKGRTPLLSEAYCPKCGDKLKQTTYYFQGETLYETPIFAPIQTHAPYRLAKNKQEVD